MRPFFTALITLTIAFSIEAEEAKRFISLEDAKNYAVEQNYGIQALKEEVNVQDGELRAQRSNFFPKFGAVVGREYSDSKGTTEEANLGYLYGSINLFNGFADQSKSNQAESLKDIAESEYRNGVHKLKLEVEELYYSYLFKKDTLKFIEDAIKINSQHLETVRRRSNSGMASTSDLMEFKLHESFLLSEKASIEQDMLETKLHLVRLMGPALGTNFEPKGALPHFHIDGKIDSYLEQVNTSTESLKQSILRTDAALSELRAERSKWLPSIDLEVQAGALPLDDRVDSDSNVNVNGLLTAKWEFFSGFHTNAKIQQAKSHLRQRELEQKQTLLTSMANVETALRKLQSIQKRVDFEENNEKFAERLYKTTLSEYKRGVKNSADLKGVAQMVTETKIKKSSFNFEFLKTKIDLERSYNIKIQTSKID